MKNIGKLLLLGAVAFAFNLPAVAKDKSEAEYMADLASPKESLVIAALQGLEKNYPTDPAAVAKVKSMLTDPRPRVHEKAARVLGAIHADVSGSELATITAMLNSPDKNEVGEALKALRGLKAEGTVPKIVPLLKHADANVKRDACRTLAVLGTKSNVSDIQPLLSDPDKAVVKDANDAIYTLNNK